VVSSPSFTERVALLKSQFPNCKPIPFEEKNPIELSDSVGLKAIQGIFRSCPDFRDALLLDPSGKKAAFVVFPEVVTKAFEVGSYNDVLPVTRVDRDFPTQVKPRWAVLTDMSQVKKERMVLYSPGLSSELKGEQAKEVSNLGILRCSLVKGSARLERADPRVSKGILDHGDKLDKAAYALGYSEDSFRSAYEEFRNQDEFAVFFEEFLNSTLAEVEFWNSARDEKCLTLYELVHGTLEQKKIAQPFLEKRGATFSAEEVNKSCPGLMHSIALYTAQASQLLPFGEGAVATKPNLKICPHKLDEYVTNVVPAVKEAFESCKKRWAGGKVPVKPIVLPNPGCDAGSQTILEATFLARDSALDLGADELGDNPDFLMN